MGRFQAEGEKTHAMSCMEFDAMCDQFYSKDLHYFDTVGLALPLHSIHVMFTHRSCRVVLEPAGICGRSGPTGAPLHPPRPTSPTHRPSAVRARKRMGRHPKRTAYTTRREVRATLHAFALGFRAVQTPWSPYQQLSQNQSSNQSLQVTHFVL